MSSLPTVEKETRIKRAARLIQATATGIELLLTGLRFSLDQTGDLPDELNDLTETLVWNVVELRTLADRLDGGV